MNPFFKAIKEVVLNPKIAILLDDSESTTIEKGGYEGLKTYRSIIAQLRDQPDNVDVTYFKFSGSIQNVDPDSFNPGQPVTNLFNAIEAISTSDEDFESAILVSDGIITEGKNPIILSGESPFPINVVGLGDTTRVKDISIQNIATNATGFTNTKHNIEVDISQFGFDNQIILVSIYSGPTKIDELELTLDKDRLLESVSFDIELNSPGLKQFKVDIEPIPEEWITENNSTKFSVDVLDSKKRILHIASSVHPDVRMLRSILSKDENIELSTYTYLNPTTSINDLNSLGDYDLIIYHGAPSPSTLAEFEIPDSGYSSLYISLPTQDIINSGWYNLLSNSTNQFFNITLVSNSESQDHPVIDINDINLNSLAPLRASIQAVNDYPNAQTLLSASYQNVTTSSPILTLLEQGNTRRSHVNAFDWFKMYLSPNLQEREFVERLFSNLIDWTSSNPDNRLLKVSPSKNEFNSSESPVINASLINENGDVENEGVIELTLTGENYSSNFNMENLGNGNYRLQTPNLPEGQYSYQAIARKGNREIDSQNGEFFVNQSNVELANIIRNEDLLKGIAANSNGYYIEHSDISDLWNNRSILDKLDQKSVQVENYIFPVRSIYWFLIVLILLGSEWVLRKKFALP
jgi:hypothetical protein